MMHDVEQFLDKSRTGSICWTCGSDVLAVRVPDLFYTESGYCSFCLDCAVQHDFVSVIGDVLLYHDCEALLS